MVFVERVEKQLAMLHDIAVPPNSAARQATSTPTAAYPQYDWVAFANKFVGETLGLCRSQYTTQIEHYDNLAAIFDNMKRIDTILIDLCRDHVDVHLDGILQTADQGGRSRFERLPP